MAMTWTSFDLRLMRRLFKLSRSMAGKTGRNPAVSAAVCRGTSILSMCVHAKEGEAHAEILAMAEAGSAACKGATLYITLSPCSHHGKTPPCVDAIIAAGISEVVYSVEDVNPIVAARSSKHLLIDSGIRVRSGLLAFEGRHVHGAFLNGVLAQKPYVTLKVGMSLDGKIALASGESMYITGEKSRKDVHRLRAVSDAILVGIGTILTDNPSLTIRLKRQTQRVSKLVVLDRHARFPLDAKVTQFYAPEQLLIFVDDAAPEDQVLALSKVATVIRFSMTDGPMFWDLLLKNLYIQGISTLLIEGGVGIFSSAVAANCVDCFVFYVAPCLLGEAARSPFSLPQIQHLSDRYFLDSFYISRCGNDVKLVSYNQRYFKP